MVGHEMNETAEAADQSNAAFRELGISFKEMKELSKNPDKALTSILDKIGKIENKSERAAIAKKIFGTTSFLNIPAGGMDEMIALARKHHQLVTGKTAAEAAAFKDAMTKVQNSFTGIFNVLIQGGRLEIITRFLERSADAIGNMAEGIDSILGNLNQFPNLKSTLGRSAGFEFIDALMDALGNNKNGSREMMKKLLMY
jgi:hypothetical protein